MKAIFLSILLCFLGGSSLAQDLTGKRFEERLDSLEAEKLKLLEQLERINAEISEASSRYGQYQNYQSRIQFEDDVERAKESAYKYAKENELPFVIHDIRLKRDRVSEAMGLRVVLHLISDREVTAISLKSRLARQSKPNSATTDTLEVDFDLSSLSEKGFLDQQWDNLWEYSQSGSVNLIEAKVSYSSGEEKVIPDLHCLVIPYLSMCE